MKVLLIPPWLLLIGCSCIRQDSLIFSVVPDEGYNGLFTRTDGWTGGDVASTIPLNDSTTLWLFGDSWIGPVTGNRHDGASMINNAVAIQHGKKSEPGWDKDYFCYAARGHAELSSDNELLISYICNSFDFWKMAADARIYIPRFIRVRFGE